MKEKTRSDYIFESVEKFVCFWDGLGGDFETSIEISEEFYDTLVREFKGGDWDRLVIDKKLKTLTVETLGYTFNFKAKQSA